MLPCRIPVSVRHPLLLSALLLALSIPDAAWAGRVSVLFDDFEAPGTPDTTDFSGTNGWTAGFSGDAWRSDLNGGVQPKTDLNPGDTPYGEDTAADNYLVNGELTWVNQHVEVLYHSFDDDSVGVIARWQDPKNFYVCFVTRDGELTANGFIESTQSRAVLQRVRDGVPEDLDRRTDFAVLVAGETHRVQIRAIGDKIQCLLDDNPDNGDNTPPDILLEGADPNPIPSGKAGIYAVDAQEVSPESFFDDFRVWLNDADGDGLTDDDETLLGLDAFSSDTDGDGIGDRSEIEAAYGATDPLNPDTDGDGLLDGTEAFGPNQTDPTNPDTDGGGAPDGEEDTNLNGMRDAGERSPVDPSDDDGIPSTVPPGSAAANQIGGCSVVPLSGTSSPAFLGFALLLPLAWLRRRR